MPNIKFNYLYRDSGNYKVHRSVIFANPGNISVLVIKALVESKLIDGTWFYARKWNLPELFPDTCDLNNDPTWHEFDSVEYRDKRSNTNLSNFIAAISQNKFNGNM